MKMSKDGRSTGATNIAQSQQAVAKPSASHQKSSSNAHQMAGSSSQRKTSQIRSGVHSHTKSTNNSTSVKSRQNGGSSTSGNRATVSGNQGFLGSNYTDGKDSGGQPAVTNYSQYGLVVGQQRRAQVSNNSSASTSNQLVINNEAHLAIKSAKQPGSCVQTHQKTKSTHLPNSQGQAQFQASANEGFSIYANNAGQAAQATANQANAATLAQKHSRHQSNPTWIMMQGGGTNSNPISGNFDAQQPGLNVQMPKGQLVGSVSEENKPARSKQINQSNAIVGGNQPNHQRFNSSKFGTQANSSNMAKIQKSGGGGVSTGGQTNNNQSVNTTNPSGGALGNLQQSNVSTSAVSKTTGGHKKSSSMANSKITQLLLKAGSKHYIQQNQMQQALQQNVHAVSKQQPVSTTSQQLNSKQSQRGIQYLQHAQLGSNAMDQSAQNMSSSATAIQAEAQAMNAHAFVQSYEVPTRSNDMLLEAQKMPTSNPQVYSNINKSMDMAQQVTAFNNLHQMQANQQVKEKLADENLQKILQVSDANEASNQNEEYQEHLSRYLGGKQNKTYQAALSGQPSHLNQQYPGQSNSDNKYHHKTAKAIAEQSNPNGLQQPMLFAQQLNTNQQVNGSSGPSASQLQAAQKISSSSVATSGIEKIARQGKVISNTGVTVKKPSATHVKNLSVNNPKPGQFAAVGSTISNNNSKSAVQQSASGSTTQNQKTGVHANHQRTKSDQVGSDFTLIINMGKVIQNQKGKVGEILKNNFIDAQIAARQSVPPGSVPHTSGKATQSTSKHMRTYTGNDRSKSKNASGVDFSNVNLSQKQMINNSQISKTTSMNSKKQPSGVVSQSLASQISKKVAIAQAKNQSKTIQEKYDELECKYNELLEQLESKKVVGASGEQRTVSMGQTGMRMSPMDNILQREANQASLSSLSSKNFNQNLPHAAHSQQQQVASTSPFLNQQQVHQNNQQQQIANPRMIRYLNNQQKMQQQQPQLLQAQTLSSSSHRGEPSINNNQGGHTVDNRSADIHTYKQQSLIDMTEMTISNPFDDGFGDLAPPLNSKQASIPVSSTASANQVIQATGLVPSKRKNNHNRVNTHYYGQQIGDPHQKMALRQTIQVSGDENSGDKLTPSGADKSSTSTLGRAEALQIAQQKHQQQLESLRRRKSDATTSSTGQIVQPSHSSQIGAQPGQLSMNQAAQATRYNHQNNTRQQVLADLAVSKTQQTPRMVSQTKESAQSQMMRLPGVQGGAQNGQTGHAPPQQVDHQNAMNIGSHTRMLWQNLVSVNHEHQKENVMMGSAADDFSKGQKYHPNQQPPHQQAPTGGNHRRSVSDGNNPGNNFNFKQHSSGITVGPATTTIDQQQQQQLQLKEQQQQLQQKQQTDSAQKNLVNSAMAANQQESCSTKQTLSHYSMQQRKRLDQQAQQQLQQFSKGGVTYQAPAQASKSGPVTASKGTRSQSRSKKVAKPHNADLTVSNVHPADITSLESADNHHHPNSQIVFAQIAQDRKQAGATSTASGGKGNPTQLRGANGAVTNNPQQSLSKESFASKKISHVKKSSKGSINPSNDRRSLSNGPAQNLKADAQKKAHNRMKSNSYRQNKQDSSFMGATAASNNDPSVEGQIQNPSTAVINGRFIEMAQGGASSQQPKSKVMIKRGENNVPFSVESSHLPADMQAKFNFETKETQFQHTQQQQHPGNGGKNQPQTTSSSSKRAFHHPALSQPNPWVPNMARASQEMFIVQENTSSNHSLHGADVSDDAGSRKITIDSRGGNTHGVRTSSNNEIGLSPVIGAVKLGANKPHLNNLLKSQGPPASVYSNEQINSNRGGVSHSLQHQHFMQDNTNNSRGMPTFGHDPVGGQANIEYQKRFTAGKTCQSRSEKHQYANNNGSLDVNDGKLEMLSIERKRAAIVKNQAQKHPICQANATGHIKNKLSTNSEDRQVVIEKIPINSTAISKHKRHKSDTVENHGSGYLYQPLINSSQQQLAGDANKHNHHAQMQSASGAQQVHLQKKEIKTAQISPNISQNAHLLDQQKAVFCGGDAFYAEHDKSGNKKLVNISIDELNADEMPSDCDLNGNHFQQKHSKQHAAAGLNEQDRALDRSKWIEVIRENSGKQMVKQHDLSSGGNAQQQQWVQQQRRDQQVNEKRKKFMQAYQMKSDSLSRDRNSGEIHDGVTASSNAAPSLGAGNRAARGSNKLITQQRVASTSNPQNVMLIEERHSTEDLPSHSNEQLHHHAKYKNIYSIAKRKFKSKSYVPPHIQMMKNSQSSSIEHDQSTSKQMAAGSAEDLSKLNYKQQQYEGIPADPSQQSQKKISININIPSEIQGHSDKILQGTDVYPVSQRSLADSTDQPNSRTKSHSKSKKLAKQPMKQVQSSKHAQMQQQAIQNSHASKEVLVPLHSLELQNFRGIQSTTPPQQKHGLKAPKASVQKNNFLPDDKLGASGQFLPVASDMRIETYSSIEHDVELSAKEKIFKKICKYVRLSFSQTGQAPQTTVDFYRIGKILGKGAFGKVNLALHHLTQHMVAIKSINKQYFSEESQRRKVLNEVVILKQTRHKHIVRLFEFFETQKHILFVIEIAAGGDLLNYVRKRRQLKEDVAKSVFKQLISGLHYCHSKGILHRDIKLDNILLSNNGEVKICDFGVSKVIRRGEIMTEQCGTPAYIAPEILKDRGYEGFGVDIWSSGVVLYAMLYGIVPFRANNMNELQKMIIKADYKLQDCISKEARDILSGLLEKDPAKRLTTRQILAHPWMADARDSVELFTQAEKNYIKSEYTYNDSKRYNRNTVTGNPEYESDAFVDAMLDTNENSILKNAETKSVILAPFNSTKSNIETGEEFLEQVRDLLEDRRCIKFAPRVREIAKQYEVNNNAELDNGVQHDFLEEEAKAKEEELKNNNGDKSSKLNMLDELIKQEESLQMSARGPPPTSYRDPCEAGNDDGEVGKNPYSASEDVPPDSGSRLSPGGKNIKGGANLAQNEIGEAQNSLAPQTSKHQMIESNETIMIDESILERLADFGYPREAVVQCLNKNELNNATTAYWLIQMALQMQATEEASLTQQMVKSVRQEQQTLEHYP